MAQLLCADNKEEGKPRQPRNNSLTLLLSISEEDDSDVLSEICHPLLLHTCLVMILKVMLTGCDCVFSFMASTHKQMGA